MGCFVRVGCGCGVIFYYVALLIISSSLLGRPLLVELAVVVLFFCCRPAGNISRVVDPSFSGFADTFCIEVVSSHFYFGHRFGLPLCCDASCLVVCILLAGPFQWSGRFSYGFVIEEFCHPVPWCCSVGL